jgi:hypothetical protein
MTSKIEAETILKLIETADPRDMVNLDEIDYWANCYIQRLDRIPPEFYLAFTHSRDALKAFRPKGWIPTACYYAPYNMERKTQGRVTALSKPIDADEEDFVQFTSSIQHEELAELHVIIQAIGWERKKAGAESVAVVERATV